MAYDLEADAKEENSIGETQIGLARAQLHATYALISATLDAKSHDEPISEGWYDVTKWGDV
jgi:hypothetical protein